MFKSIKNQLRPYVATVGKWVKLIGITGSAQIGIQGIGLLCGILIIRVLPTTEYAFYTLANTMLGTMVMLANAGIPIAVLSEGGKVWQDKIKLGEVLVTGFNFRKKFAIGSLIVGVPILVYLLNRNDASWITIGLIILVIVPVFYAQLSDVLLQIAPKLKQDIVPLQKTLLGVNLGRLILLGFTILFFPFSFVALLPSSIPQVLGNLRLRKITAHYVDWDQKPSAIIQKKMTRTVQRVLPEAIYYSISGQITIWLLSIFGSATAIAEIGALGRIAMVINLVSILFATLVIPRFARLGDEFKLLIRRFLQVNLLVFLIFSAIVVFVYLFPSQILWVLGPNYSNLEYELLLAVIGSCLSIFSGITFSLYSSRGWVINPLISIPLSMFTITIAILLTDVTTLQGVLILNIIIGSIQFGTHFCYGLFKIFKTKSNRY